MADERQILIASLREHFEGIVEATDLFLRTTDNGGDEEEGASLAELEAARGANSILKAESAEWRKRALEMIPERLQPYRSIGSCYESLGDYRKAAETYRRSLDADINQPDILQRWNLVKQKLK